MKRRANKKRVKAGLKLLGERADLKKHSDGFVSLAFSGANAERQHELNLDAFKKGIKEGGERGIPHGAELSKQEYEKAYQRQNEKARLEQDRLKQEQDRLHQEHVQRERLRLKQVQDQLREKLEHQQKSNQSKIKWKRPGGKPGYATSNHDTYAQLAVDAGQARPTEKEAKRLSKNIFSKYESKPGTAFEYPFDAPGGEVKYEIKRRWVTDKTQEHTAYVEAKTLVRAAKRAAPKPRISPPPSPPKPTGSPKISPPPSPPKPTGGPGPIPPPASKGHTPPPTPDITKTPPIPAPGNIDVSLIPPGSQQTPPAKSVSGPIVTQGVGLGLLAGSKAIAFGSSLSPQYTVRDPDSPTSSSPKSDPAVRKLDYGESPTSETTVTNPVDTKIEEIFDTPVDESKVDLNTSESKKALKKATKLQSESIKKT